MSVAIIPARGGSQRIPGKNIRDFVGKPIIAYSIEAALRSHLFERVIVSSDDEKIQQIASDYGAETPFTRPSILSDEFCGTADVVKHALQFLQQESTLPEFVCCIYATAPFLDEKYLRRGLELLEESQKQYAFSVTQFHFPVQRALRINKQNEIEAVWPEFRLTRSQDLEPRYHDAAQFYWGRREAFLNDEVLYSTNSLPVVVPAHLVQDIDTEEDWRRAELMFRAIQLEKEDCA